MSTRVPAIVTTSYRYKRPPRKRKPVAIEAPAVVTANPGSTRPDSGKGGPEVRDRHRPGGEGEVRRRARHDAGGAPAARRCRRRAVARAGAPGDRQGP